MKYIGKERIWKKLTYLKLKQNKNSLTETTHYKELLLFFVKYILLIPKKFNINNKIKNF